MRSKPPRTGPVGPILLLALALGCGGAEPAPRADGAGRDLLALGPDARVLAGTGTPGTPRRQGARRTLRLADGERVLFHLELRAPARLRVALRGRPGRLDVDLGSFDPQQGQSTTLSAQGSLGVGPAGEGGETIDLPDPGGEVLVVALTWHASDAGDEVRVTELELLEEGETPPSILFVSIDTFSASHMSLYGYARETTPQLDRLAAQGVTFDQALANGTWTTPSYVSQLAGVTPSALRLHPWRWEWRIPADRWTLAEMLRARGYRTAAFIDNLNVAPRYGTAQGFEVFDMSGAEITTSDPEGGARHILPLAEDWLDEVTRTGAPFFLLVQLVDLHAPYLPPGDAEGTFDVDDGLFPPDATLPIEGPGEPHPRIQGAVPRYVARYAEEFKAGRTRMFTAPLIAAYDDQIAALDARLGRFFDRLEGRGILDRSAVVISADHGETMLEHDVYFRHVHNFQENVRVPLVVRLPGGAGGGRRVPDLVELVDLYPTFAELAGLDPERRAPHGRSLVPLLEGRSRPARPVLTETGVGNSDSIVFDGWKLVESYPGKASLDHRMTHARTRRWLEENFPETKGMVFGTVGWEDAASSLPHPKLTWDLALEYASDPDPWYELYDLENDPEETVNLAESEPDKRDEMLELLHAQRERSAATRERVRPDLDPAPPPLTQEEIAELEKLGYAAE